MKKLLLIALLSVTTTANATWFELKPESAKHKQNAFTITHGQGTNENLSQIMGGQVSRAPYEMIATSYSTKLADYDTFLYILRNMLVEGEIQVASHYGNQDFIEYVANLNLRFYEFPWNNTIKTTLAFGIGASYASDIPELETIRVGNHDSHELIYLGGELTLAAPSWQNFETVFRIHHRSGAWGTVNSITGGSNYLNAGIRYKW